MSMLESAGDWFKWYLFGKEPAAKVSASAISLNEASGSGHAVTGDGLVESIVHTITRGRGSVILYGPRGCGKSYCADKAIRTAVDRGAFGGWRFLQGNREIPREMLSEDMLVLDRDGKPQMLEALAIRPLTADQYLDDPRRLEFPTFPGIPASAVSGFQEACAIWRPEDWVVLFLDEINRFGDGFLDSLLSFVEEKKITRRGEEFFVPFVVVATANPPGYDATAKKLSPPLEARFTQRFWMSQPRFEDLMRVVVPAELKALAARYPDARFQPSFELAGLAAGVVQCLWGDPKAEVPGIEWLAPETREANLDIMRRDQKLARAMQTLSGLSTFGPDTRAVLDWLHQAAALAEHHAEPIAEKHLEATAASVLCHRVRYSFNEGADPGKMRIALQAIHEVVRRVFYADRVRARLTALSAELHVSEAELKPARVSPQSRSVKSQSISRGYTNSELSAVR